MQHAMFYAACGVLRSHCCVTHRASLPRFRPLSVLLPLGFADATSAAGASSRSIIRAASVVD